MALVVKVKYKVTLRRFNAFIKEDGSLDLSLDGLRSKISELFHFSPNAQFVITYVDGDNDIVTMVDDSDLLDAFGQGLNPLCLKVSMTSQNNRGRERRSASIPSTPRNAEDVQAVDLSNTCLDETLKLLTEPAQKALIKFVNDGPVLCSSSTVSDLVQVITKLVNIQLGPLMKNQVAIGERDATQRTNSAATATNDAGEQGIGNMQSLSNDRSGPSAPPVDDPRLKRNRCFEENMHQTFHKGVGCDGCGTKPIIGPRFKSMVKENYDLCQDCYCDIGNENEYTRIDRAGPLAPPVDNPLLKRNWCLGYHKGVGCDGCGMNPIIGPRFKSRVKHNYDLCQGCYCEIGNEDEYTRIDRAGPLYPPVDDPLLKRNWCLGYHKGVRCDGCGMKPIIGPRFKSRVKQNYDLCQGCYCDIGNENEYTRIDRAGPLAPPVDNPLLKRNWCLGYHKGVGCDGCGMNPIIGPRFKSRVKQNYDLCQGCYCEIGNEDEYTRIDRAGPLSPPVDDPLLKRNWCLGYHKGVRCDGCGMKPIIGPRFKSRVKQNYDLCQGCYCEIGNEDEYTRIDRAGPLAPPVDDPLLKRNWCLGFHKGVGCDGCGMKPIIGPRFKSMVKENYDLCQGCYCEIGNENDYTRIDRAGPLAPPVDDPLLKRNWCLGYHKGVGCDGCGMNPIIGPRFKSRVKQNYDLCRGCYCEIGNEDEYTRIDRAGPLYAPVDDPLLKKNWCLGYHKGVRCDGCGMKPISGPRFKSMVKQNYDLCQGCYCEIGNEDEYTRIDRAGPLAPPVDDPLLKRNCCLGYHKGVGCDGCGMEPIIGPRFKSMVKENYDLCQSCYCEIGNENEYTRIDRAGPLAPPVDNPLLKRNWCLGYHKGVGCDGCGMNPIIGPRFKSRVKQDYDLCQGCYCEIGNEDEYTRIDRAGPSAPPVDDPLLKRNWCLGFHKGVGCDGCGMKPIIGPRFKSYGEGELSWSVGPSS